MTRSAHPFPGLPLSLSEALVEIEALRADNALALERLKRAEDKRALAESGAETLEAACHRRDAWAARWKRLAKRYRASESAALELLDHHADDLEAAALELLRVEEEREAIRVEAKALRRQLDEARDERNAARGACQ